MLINWLGLKGLMCYILNLCAIYTWCVSFPTLVIWIVCKASHMRITFLLFSDPRTQEWPFVTSVCTPITCVVIYLAVVLIGPKIMKSREPLQLMYPMVLYNITMTTLNFYIFLEVCKTHKWIHVYIQTGTGTSHTLWFYPGKLLKLIFNLWLLLILWLSNLLIIISTVHMMVN